MAKFVAAFRDRDTAEKIASLLRESGYEVMRICTSGDEVKRTFHTLQDGILISGVRLKDRTLDDIAPDLNEHVEILCLYRPNEAGQISSPRVFRQTLPVTRPVLITWADMLVQLHYQNLPHRTDKDRETIRKAKTMIMEEKHMNEGEAHRYLQQLSMNLGIRMSDVAERIVNADHQAQ